jgi:hypothetical protein
LSKQNCEQEIAQQKIEITKQGNTVDAICVDMEVKVDKYNTVYQTLNKLP